MARRSQRPLIAAGRIIQRLQNEAAIGDTDLSDKARIARSTLWAAKHNDSRQPTRGTMMSIATVLSDALRKRYATIGAPELIRQVTVDEIFGREDDTGPVSGDAESQFHANGRENAQARHIAFHLRPRSQRARGDSIQRVSVRLRGILQHALRYCKAELGIANALV